MKTVYQLALCAALAGISFAAQAKVSDGAKYGDWTGACSQGVCGIAQTGKDKNGRIISSIVIRNMPAVDNAKKTSVNIPTMFITVPLGVSLNAGLGVAVDKKGIGVTRFDFCTDNGCLAAIPMDAKLTSALKKGHELEIGMIFVGQAKPVQTNASFSLKGITSALGKL